MKNTKTNIIKAGNKERRALRLLFEKFIDSIPARSRKIEEGMFGYTTGVYDDSREAYVASEVYRLHTQFITELRFRNLFSKDEALNEDYEYLTSCFDKLLKSLIYYTAVRSIKDSWIKEIIDYYTKRQEEFYFVLSR